MHMPGLAAARQVMVDVARGFEYEPLRQVVEIKPGQRELTLNLKRWVDMNGRRWSAAIPMCIFWASAGPPRSGGEDLNVVNLLASQWGHLFNQCRDSSAGPR